MMKKIWLFAFIMPSIYGMQSEIVPYSNISFITPEQLQHEGLTPLPADLKAEVDAWNQEFGGIIEEFTTLPKTVDAFRIAAPRRQHYKKPHATPRDVGQFNHIFKTRNAVIRIPGLQNALGEQSSAMGIDRSQQTQVDRAGGYDAILAADKPRQQGVSRLLAAHMLKKLNSPAIKTPDVWAYHIEGQPEELDDRNYVMIQRHFPANLRSFDSLTPTQKNQVFQHLPLVDLYNAMKYTALWQFKGDDIYVNPDNIQEIWLVDLEKPSNEGYDPSAAPGERGTPFRNVAVYGRDKDKWKFNIYYKENESTGHGFMQIKNWIKANAPERVAEWDQLRANDPDAPRS